MSGQVSTTVGDHVGIPGVVLLLISFLLLLHLRQALPTYLLTYDAITALYSNSTSVIVLKHPLFCSASWLLLKQIGGCTHLFILGFGFILISVVRADKQLSYIMI